ncbi:MAG: PAS domain S-box protein [Planctomycetota bacterium]
MTTNTSPRDPYLQDLANSMSDCVICLDAAGTITEFNRAAEKLFGYTREEAVNRPVTILMEAEDQTGHVAGFQSFLSSRGRNSPLGKRMEVVGRTKSGERVPISMTVAYMEYDSLPQVIGTMRDLRPIHHQQRVQEYLNATFESIDVGVAIYDTDLRLVSWNSVFEDISVGDDTRTYEYGTSLRDVYQVCASHGLFGSGDPEEIASNRASLAVSNLRKHEKLTASDHGLVVRVDRYRLPSGGLCEIYRDITADEKRKDDLRQAQKLEALGQLAGGISHDLKNVLTAVIGHVELLESRVKDPQGESICQSIVDAAKSGGQLLERLLSFSKKRPLKTERVEVGALMSSTSVLLERTLGTNVQLEIFDCSDTWPCRADRAQLQNAIVNLAVNARDAMDSVGTIRLECSKHSFPQQESDSSGEPGDANLSGDFVEVRVTDDGPGMTPEVLEHALEPFYTTKGDTGTGLGLAMVQRFVTQSGGRIEIDTGPNGTCVSLFLPRFAELDSTVPPAANLAPEESPCVLLVEDDTSVRGLVTLQLEALDYRVLAAADGKRALDHLSSGETIDCVVSDVCLPGNIGGMQVGLAAEQRLPGVGVLYISGHSRGALMESGQIPPNAPFLAKPFGLAALRDALAELTVHQ